MFDMCLSASGSLFHKVGPEYEKDLLNVFVLAFGIYLVIG